jgi:DNA polymerase-3 subunit delta'
MSFKDIIGHEKQIRILQSAALRNRLSHAYLFYGMEGIGKRTVAETFAKALNCDRLNTAAPEAFPGNNDFDSCDRCPSCYKADRNSHSDIVTVKPDGQFIRVREIRDIQEQMKFAPLEGKRRIFLMTDADRMNSISANALLKTLEEPSRNNLLILLTSSPHQLPVTILSRCQPVRFNPLNRDTVASFLQKRLSMDTERACAIASSSAGSIGKALEMNDDSRMTIRNDILQIILTGHEKEPLTSLAAIGSFGKDREVITDSLHILMTGYRDALIYKETGNDEHIINRHCKDIVQTAARRLSRREILDNIRSVDWAMNAIDRNANKKLTLEVMLFKLIHHRK